MRSNKRLSTLILLIMLIVSFGLAGCGTEGPLYIPEQRYPQDTK